MNKAHYTGTHAVCQAFFRPVFVSPDSVSTHLFSFFPDRSARPRAGRAGVAISRTRFESPLRPAHAFTDPLLHRPWDLTLGGSPL